MLNRGRAIICSNSGLVNWCICVTCHNENNNSLSCILTHWGRVTHICVSKLTIIVSDNGLSPGRRQDIIWPNTGILLIWTSGTNFSEILNEIRTFSFKKMHLKMSSGKWRPSCLSLNVLTIASDDQRCFIKQNHLDPWIKDQLKSPCCLQFYSNSYKILFHAWGLVPSACHKIL